VDDDSWDTKAILAPYGRATARSARVSSGSGASSSSRSLMNAGLQHAAVVDLDLDFSLDGAAVPMPMSSVAGASHSTYVTAMQ